MHRQEGHRSLASNVFYWFGRVEMLLGLLSLGLAAFLLRFEARRHVGATDLELRLRLMTTVLTRAIVVLATSQSDIPDPRAS